MVGNRCQVYTIDGVIPIWRAKKLSGGQIFILDRIETPDVIGELLGIHYSALSVGRKRFQNLAKRDMSFANPGSSNEAQSKIKI